MKNGSKNKTHIVELLKELNAKMHNKDLLNIYLDKFLEIKISRQRICLHILFSKLLTNCKLSEYSLAKKMKTGF